MQGTRGMRRHLVASELQGLGKTSKEAEKEPGSAWLVRLWNMGGDEISKARKSVGVT